MSILSIQQRCKKNWIVSRRVWKSLQRSRRKYEHRKSRIKSSNIIKKKHYFPIFRMAKSAYRSYLNKWMWGYLSGRDNLRIPQNKKWKTKK
jgi:hypothetical protein